MSLVTPRGVVSAGSGRVAGDDEGLRSLLAAIVESSPDAIISATLDGVVTSWNAGAAAMYGYTAEEMVGRSLSVLIPPGREDELAALLDRVRAGHQVEPVVTQRVRKDRAVIDVSLSMSPIRDADGTVTGMAGIASDVTGRIRAERAAQETQSRLAAIVESSSDAITGKTLDGVITSWNAGAVNMYGYAAQGDDRA